MSKGALDQLTPHFARHLAPRRITVNSVLPGATDNGSTAFQMPEVREPMSQLSAFKRLEEPEEIANVVVFLATDQARSIAGASLDATGGSLLGQQSAGRRPPSAMRTETTSASPAADVTPPAAVRLLRLPFPSFPFIPLSPKVSRL
ncbi:SDR family NAD(P)-dependent oxidoreductase [Streptomyces coeruleorubidus]|uniref:SDR family NAD(P)-dependent oxidoreductase n=1 Tax=Streptomyces coeruleorubidus TaxID=116188 RepID=UPI00199D8D7C|nr:SDR family oxidoreductase [Streptomyces bellus]GGU21808.1 hypothetical protein GCM10010244_55490 [Streptomyces bellus]